jgi:hypothetical protein
VRKNGGWFGSLPGAPDLPRDESVLTEEDQRGYADALKRNGFFGPDSWYMNAERNVAFAKEAPERRPDRPAGAVPARRLRLGLRDRHSRLAEPMRASCANLTEAT